MLQVAWTWGELEEVPSLMCFTRLTGMASFHWTGGSWHWNSLIWCSNGSADGADGDLYGAGSDLLSFAAVPTMYVFGKSGDEFNLLDGGDRGEHGVHVMERCNEVCPMVLIALSFFVIHCHDASVNALPLSLEKTSKVSLELRWKLCHKVS